MQDVEEEVHGEVLITGVYVFTLIVHTFINYSLIFNRTWKVFVSPVAPVFFLHHQSKPEVRVLLNDPCFQSKSTLCGKHWDMNHSSTSTEFIISLWDTQTQQPHINFVNY